MITVPPQLAGEAITLYVKERSLNGITEQLEMSQGMFRALSILIHVIYGFYSNSASLLLIDDIGEGLDFERSTALIGVLMDRTKNSNVQLVMATNDRFIMNSVPLEYWSVLTRDGSLVTVSNYTNSKQKFEDFKFTGLNNFDFFLTYFPLLMSQWDATKPAFKFCNPLICLKP